MNATLIDTDTNDTRIREVYEVLSADQTEIYSVKLHTTAGDNGATLISASLTDETGKALRTDDGEPYILPNPMNWLIQGDASEEQKEAMRATIIPSVLGRAVSVARADEAVAPLQKVEGFVVPAGLSAVPIGMLTGDHGKGSLTVDEPDPAVEFAQAKIDALLHDKALMEARWAEMQDVMARAIADAEADLAAVAPPRASLDEQIDIEGGTLPPDTNPAHDGAVS